MGMTMEDDDDVGSLVWMKRMLGYKRKKKRRGNHLVLGLGSWFIASILVLGLHLIHIFVIIVFSSRV